ncbi:hypothetical protein SAMN05216456_1000 [Devosia crocina]|uniref:Uncharacterized protein n=1 Tax=Devosia crocina TaxID=429728 RepID=A0A1I7N6T5_9HYPH|nr:hypothetical protein [Devosia crocina]SFV30380.1 hypothetical protein SAMN05216456_1000 [Devosia crocina]
MKKILALVLASVMVAGAAAPSFAAETCAFKDVNLCTSESLVSYSD